MGSWPGSDVFWIAVDTIAPFAASSLSRCKRLRLESCTFAALLRLSGLAAVSGKVRFRNRWRDAAGYGYDALICEACSSCVHCNCCRYGVLEAEVLGPNDVDELLQEFAGQLDYEIKESSRSMLASPDRSRFRVVANVAAVAVVAEGSGGAAKLPLALLSTSIQR